MDLRRARRLVTGLWRIVSRRYRNVLKDISGPQRGVGNRLQLVRKQLVEGIEMESDACGCGNECFRIYVADDRDDTIFVRRVFQPEAAGIEEELDARPRCALRKLRAQKLVDPFEARIGSVRRVGLASAEGERQQ